MKYRVRLLPPARSDLIRVSNFLADVAPAAALYAADVLDKALRTLEHFPERTPKNGLGGRDMVVRFGRAGYVIRYRIKRAEVIVHGSKKSAQKLVAYVIPTDPEKELDGTEVIALAKHTC